MRILFIHEVNYLTKPIFEMHEFPEYLAQRGHEVGFIHFPEGYSRKQLRGLHQFQKIHGRAASSAEITLITPWTSSISVLNRLLAAALFPFQFSRVLGVFKPDVIVSFSVPTSGWQSLLIAKMARIPFVFRALDVSHKIRKTFFSSLVKRAEKFVASHSNWVSANNQAMLEYCLSLGAVKENSSVDFPPLNFSHFDIRRDIKLRRKLNINDNSKIIIYMGSFFYFSGLPEFIREFSRLSDENQILLLVGGGEQELELKELVRALKIQKRVLFSGYVSFEQLPNYLSIADVAVNPMQPALVSHTALPNKVIQYMAAGLPVVSSRLRGLELTFPNTPGLSFANSPSEMVRCAQEFLLNPNGLGRKNQKQISNMFDIQVSVQRIEQLLETLIQERKIV